MRVRSSLLPAAAGLAAVGLLWLDHSRRRPSHRAQRYLEDMMDGARHGLHVHMPLAGAVMGAVALLGGGYLWSRRTRTPRGERHTVEESIELDVPVSTAYNQWTQFEQFPQFMATVQSVTQVDDTHLHWRALVAGKVKKWDAEITEQIPDQRIAWRSIDGPGNEGVVTFEKVDDSRTRIVLRMIHAPGTTGERSADAVGAVKLTTRGNLIRFKELLERRGHETGGWRGSVVQH